mmetsp:Transcript_12947/g.18691  ORF Transcript_12947/g.18691 Transcript_12947/m.18691 type:complete len:246 (+) Transcript_12947:1-738(+)
MMKPNFPPYRSKGDDTLSILIVFRFLLLFVGTVVGGSCGFTYFLVWFCLSLRVVSVGRTAGCGWSCGGWDWIARFFSIVRCGLFTPGIGSSAPSIRGIIDLLSPSLCQELLKTGTSSNAFTSGFIIIVVVHIIIIHLPSIPGRIGCFHMIDIIIIELLVRIVIQVLVLGTYIPLVEIVSHGIPVHRGRISPRFAFLSLFTSSSLPVVIIAIFLFRRKLSKASFTTKLGIIGTSHDTIVVHLESIA